MRKTGYTQQKMPSNFKYNLKFSYQGHTRARSPQIKLSYRQEKSQLRLNAFEDSTCTIAHMSSGYESQHAPGMEAHDLRKRLMWERNYI